MPLGRMIFLCHEIFSDANRAQFNRTRFLSEHYPLYIIANGSVSPEAAKNAQAIFIFPFTQKIFRIFFPFWVLVRVAKLVSAPGGIGAIYSTYEPRTLVMAFVISKLFKLKWIADLWDDPEKIVLATRLHKVKFQVLNSALKKFEFFWAGKILNKADKIIIGVVPKGILLKYDLSQNNVLAVTNGINLEYHFPRQTAKKSLVSKEFGVFYCGTVDPVRLEGIVPCLQILVKKIPHIRLVVAGPQMGNGYLWLKEQLKVLCETVCLDMRGCQPYDQVLNLIAESDVCICPYPDQLDLAAAYPVKIFDYMVMGKPIVASRLTGTAAIATHGEDALLFSPGDYQEMAGHLLNLYGSESLRNHLSLYARKNVCEFSWTHINRQIYKFLES